MCELQKNIEEISSLFSDYLDEYGNKYKSDKLDYIIHYFYQELGKQKTLAELLQIYDELGIYKSEDSIYQANLSKLQEHFDIGCDVLDIASGDMPAFANRLAKEQLKLGMGTVTLYEPSLVVSKPHYSNMRLYREYFTSETDISKFELVTALMPCDATLEVLDAVCVNRKKFYVSLCGCDSKVYHNHLIRYLKKQLKKYDNGELIVDYLDPKYEQPWPVLYNKKR